MSLLDSLIKKGLESASDAERQREWVESGFDKAIEEARDLVPSGDGELKEVREQAVFALDSLEANRETFVVLGAHGLRSVFSLLALGRYDDSAKQAALISIKESSWDEVTAKLIATAERGNEQKRQLDQAVEDFKKTLKEIGVKAAKALLPLLIAMI